MFASERRSGETWFCFSFLAGLCLWVLTVTTISVPIVPEGLTFGLMQLMPWHFWIGVVSVAAAAWFTIHSRRASRHLCVLVLMMLYLWGTACLVEPTARHYDPYYYGATILKLIQLGHTDVSQEVYFQWPGGFFIGSTIMLVAQLPAVSLLGLYPMVNGFVFTVSFYLLSRRAIGDTRSAFAATLFALVGESFLQLHFSPQGITNSMLPVFLMAFLSRSRPFRVVSFLLFVGIVIIHPLLPFWILLIIFGMRINSILLRTGEEVDGKRIALFTITLATWLLYTATWGFAFGIMTLEKFFASLLDVFRLEVVQRAFFVHPYPEVGFIRKGIFGFYVLLGLVGASMELKARQRGANFAFRTSMLLYAALMIPVVPYVTNMTDFSTRPVVLTILGASLTFPFHHILPAPQSQEWHDYMKRGLGMLANKLHTRYKPAILLVLIVSLSVLGTATMYAEESFLMSPESTNRGAQFVASSISTNATIFSDLVDYLFYNTRLRRNDIQLASWDVERPYDSLRIRQSNIICFRIESRVRLFYMMDTVSYQHGLEYVNTNSRFARIYDSGTFQSFRNLFEG